MPSYVAKNYNSFWQINQKNIKRRKRGVSMRYLWLFGILSTLLLNSCSKSEVKGINFGPDPADGHWEHEEEL
jgi:hypothetical protein